MSKIEYLDPEIANEGIHADKGATAVIPAWDEDEEWQPMLEPAHIPDYKGIKSIAHYFPQFSGRPYRPRPFPATFYHRKHGEKTITKQEDAMEMKVFWNKAEGGKWEAKGEWSTKPFDHKAQPEGPGKSLTSKDKSSTENTIEIVAAAVTAALAKIGNTPTAPKVQQALSSDPDYAEFMQFKAFKAKGSMTADEIAPAAYDDDEEADDAIPDEKSMLIEAAAAKGIKLDKRWGLDKIKAALEEAA